MTDQYSRGEPTFEKLGRDMLERKLATCAFGETCSGTFVRVDGNGMLVSMPAGSTSGVVLPAREIANQANIRDGRIMDAGRLSAVTTDTFLGVEGENAVMLEHFAQENGMTPDAIKIILTIFGRELAKIVARQSGLLQGNAAGRISREYTMHAAQKTLGDDVLVLLKEDPTPDEIIAG